MEIDDPWYGKNVALLSPDVISSANYWLIAYFTDRFIPQISSSISN